MSNGFDSGATGDLWDSSPYPASTQPPAAWHPDPTGRNELRYWAGSEWSDHVSNNGTVSSDPMKRVAAPAVSQFSFDLPKCSYLGSHPMVPTPIERLGVGFVDGGFLMYDPKARAVLHEIEWANIRQVRVETQGDVQARITATRVVLLGALGFFLKKTKEVAFLTIDQSDGEWMFGVEAATPARLLGALQPVKARFPKAFEVAPALPPPTVLAAPARTIADRLGELDALHQQHLVTDNEYADRRRAILDSL